MSDWKPTTTADWLVRILDRLLAIQNAYPEPVWLKGELPDWVQNIARELGKTLYPGAKLRLDKVWHPGEVGALMGHQAGYWHFLAEFIETDCTEPKPKLLDELREIFGPDIEERSAQIMQTIAESVYPAFDKVMKFSLCLASDQDHYSSSRFFAAFARALSAKPRQGNTIGRTNTMIYWVMLTSWRRVEELGSIPELYRRLCKCVFFQTPLPVKFKNEPLRHSASRELVRTHSVGEYERVERICNRMGLSYPEIEERKSRATIPDMSE